MIRNARSDDLPAIVGIYNASIPSRMATADLTPVAVRDRQAWFDEFEPSRRPLWVRDDGNHIVAWLSLRSFYGRPAYDQTVEVSVYVAAAAKRRGYARGLVEYAIAHAPGLGISTLLALTFAHNDPSIGLFEQAGFGRWGRLPGVARLDGVPRDLLILGRTL
jgi:phosphinothricin acetyltransferase